MAKLKDLKVVIGLSKSGLTKLNADLRRTKSNFRRNFGEIAGIAKRAGQVIVAGVGAGLTAVIRSGAKLQTLKVGFRSIMGSAEGAAKMVDKLNQFTASTPFQLEEVSRSARQLIAVGTGVDDVTDRLRMLGDIAAASGNSISDIAAIFAKVQAKGKVELENLNQLAERGIPIFDQLRKVTGDANMEFGAGAVKVEEFNEALAQMAEKGGFANNAMANLSETVDGRLTTAFDNVTLALGQFAEKSGLLDAVTNVLEDFTSQVQRASLSEDDLQKSREQFFDLRQKLKSAHKGNIEDLMNEAKAARQLAFDLNQVLDTMNTSAHLQGVDKFIDQLEELFAFRDTHLSTLPDAPKAKKTSGQRRRRPQDMAEAPQRQAKAIQGIALAAQNALHPILDMNAAVQDQQNLERAQALNDFFERLKETATILAGTIGQQFGNAFAQVITGAKSSAQALKMFAAEAIKASLAASQAMIIEAAIKSGKMSGPAAMFVIPALIAAGMAIVDSAFGQIPAMAAGGLFTGASLAMVGEGPGTSSINPEVVAPLDKLRNMIGGGNVNVTGTIRGRDLLLSEERSAYSRRRRFGN
jgi:tape measure domain-containing protein